MLYISLSTSDTVYSDTPNCDCCVNDCSDLIVRRWNFILPHLLQEQLAMVPH